MPLRIFIAEDEISEYKSLKIQITGALEGIELSITHASSKKEALKVIEDPSEVFDLLFLDISFEGEGALAGEEIFGSL